MFLMYTGEHYIINGTPLVFSVYNVTDNLVEK